MTNKIGIYIDYVTKFIDRFKTLIYLVLICTVIFYIITGKIDKSQALKSAKETAEKISGLNFEKDLLFDQKELFRTERDSLKEENYIIKEERDAAIELKAQEAWRSAKYKRERNEARRALVEYSPNENYDFLDNEAYPFIGEKEYLFNANQISGMRETFVENKYNKNIIESQTAELDHCNDVIEKSMILDSINDEIIKLSEEERLVDSTMLSIEEEKNDIIMDEWEKNNRKEKWRKVWNKTEKFVYAVCGFALGALIK